MFGFVLPHKPELKVSEWYTYRAVYCGLCKELKRKYGFLARFFLNYDFVLLALMADAINDSDISFTREACIANPTKKRAVCQSTKGLSISADALILTAFYKIVDNLHDDKFIKKVPSLLLYPVCKKLRNKAAKNLPHLDKVLSEQTKAQQLVEHSKTTSPDMAADASAIMTATLFEQISDDENKKTLYRFGYFLGKIIYYLDCAEDYDADKKSGAYNIFVLSGKTKEEAVLEVKRLCNMCAGEMSLCYNLIKASTYKPILDNIIYLGIPYCIENAGKPNTNAKNRRYNEI